MPALCLCSQLGLSSGSWPSLLLSLSLTAGQFWYMTLKHGLSSQGDVVLQSDHVIETLTKAAILANKINNVNINQGR